MLQETQKDSNSDNKSPELRIIFPHLDNLRHKLGEKEVLDKKVDNLREFRNTISGLNSIALSIEQICAEREKQNSLTENSRETMRSRSIVEDNIQTIRQVLNDLERRLPDSTYERIGPGGKISDFGNDDLIVITADKFSSIEITNLLQLANTISKRGPKSFSIEEGFQIAENAKNNLSSKLTDVDEYNSSLQSVDSLRSKGKLEEAHTAIADVIRSDLPLNPSQVFSEITQIATAFPSRNHLTRLGLRGSSPSIIVNKDYDSVFSIYSKDPLSRLNPDHKSKVQEIRTDLWNTSVPWINVAKAEADIRFIETTYASYKRLGILLTSLKSSLEEASILEPTARDGHRQNSVRQFWKLYEETSLFINHEFKEALLRTHPEILTNLPQQNEALISHILISCKTKDSPGARLLEQTIKVLIGNDKIPVTEELKSAIHSDSDINNFASTGFKSTEELFNLAEPYANLSIALNNITPDNIDNFYQNDLSDSNETYQRTLRLVNHAFNLLSSGLENIGASPRKMSEILNQFSEINSTHPEYALIRAWMETFKLRFHELGVR